MSLRDIKVALSTYQHKARVDMATLPLLSLILAVAVIAAPQLPQISSIPDGACLTGALPAGISLPTGISVVECTGNSTCIPIIDTALGAIGPLLPTEGSTVLSDVPIGSLLTDIPLGVGLLFVSYRIQCLFS